MISENGYLISREIEVSRDTRSGKLISFWWNSKEFQISNVIAVWSDWGFGAGAPKRKSWKMRHHRNYYRVETMDGNVFELYHDRGIKLSGGKWILHTCLK